MPKSLRPPRAPTPHTDLGEYRKAGGDVAKLVCVLADLRTESTAADRAITPAARTREIERVMCALSRFLERVPDLAHTLRVRVHELKRMLQVSQAFHAAPQVVRRRRQPTGGRPPGSEVSVLVAVLVREFRRRLHRPRYDIVLALVREVAPEEFPKSTTTDHLRQRVKHTNSRTVRDRHAQVFGPPQTS